MTPRLATLVRKELVRPDRAQLPGEDGFRFRHLLIRDAAYDGMPSPPARSCTSASPPGSSGAAGSWSSWTSSSATTWSRHIGIAVRLGLDDEGARELGRSAAARLGSAGRRALTRSDIPAQANLLGRAVALLPPEDVPAEMLSRLGTA